MEFNYIEIIGYLASIVLLVSFLKKDIKQLRIVNSIGCALFVTYGVLLSSYPIVITNLAIILINGYQLLYKKQE